jgi:two-component system, OmpR family, sensor histidine kinase KdpD
MGAGPPRDLARQAAEADRDRAVLLAAVSHDLRAPLAAAKAAVSGLRLCDARLTADDREELLAAAEESLDQLAHLAESLLDVSRLEAGAPAVVARSADLGEIVADSLDGLGPRARRVLADIPSGLPEVMADPAIMERVIANLIGNALRYSPAASPPLVAAWTAGDRVELRVIDHGPGIPKADRERVFLPFQRLGNPGDRTGPGLGLAVSRGLAEAMGGTGLAGHGPREERAVAQAARPAVPEVDRRAAADPRAANRHSRRRISRSV